MDNQFSPQVTVSHRQEHPCYQHYRRQRELAQRQIASLQQLYRQQRELAQHQIASLQQHYRQQREVKRRAAGTSYERRGSTPDSAWPLPFGKLIFP